VEKNITKKIAHGFSLIELMVVMAIMALISTLLWTSLNQTLTVKKELNEQDNKNHAIQIVFNKLSDELNSAFLGEEVGASKMVFIGEDKGEQDRLVFSSFAHYRYIKDAKESDQSELEYKLESVDENRHSLLRREHSIIDENPEEGGPSYILAENVSKFDLRYCDSMKAEWRPNWDTRKADFLNRLPLAVEVSIHFMDPETEIEETYKTIIPIESEFIKKTVSNIKVKGCEAS
jgi:general secretion pathway protein J